MSAKDKQYRVNDDGMTCRPVNPFPKYPNQPPKQIGVKGKEWSEFEASVKNYPLTVEQKPGEVIDGVIVWQWFNTQWNTYFKNGDKPQSTMFPLRKAVEPVTPSKELDYEIPSEAASIVDFENAAIRASKEVKEDAGLISDKSLFEKKYGFPESDFDFYSPVHFVNSLAKKTGLKTDERQILIEIIFMWEDGKSSNLNK